MNCKTTQRRMLLLDTGELSSRERRVVNQHLVQCDACRSFQAETRRLTELAEEALPAAEPAGWVMTRIRAQAEEKSRAHRPPLYLRPSARILAAAAMLAILVGGIQLLPGYEPRDRVSEMSAIMAMVAADDSLQVEVLGDDDHDALADVVSESTDREEVFRALANQLLIMEGLAVDEEESDWFSSPEEPQPTALQLRSTRDGRARIYG